QRYRRNGFRPDEAGSDAPLATVGIIPSLIIGVREGIEAALVIGIILGYLVKIGRISLKRHVYAGTIVAFLASAGVAAGLFAATIEFQGFGEQIFEGITMLVLVAGIIGVGIVRVSWRLNLRRFFQITGIFLVVVAAGLFANAIHELQEAFAWQLGSAAVYDLHLVFPADASNTAGYLLRGIIGYSDAPTVLEVVAYVGYWIVVLLAYMGIRTGKIEIVTAPLRRGWNALFGRKVVSSADAE